jgi:uncharacterized membrane protein
MDGFLSGLVCGGLFLFLPVAGVAVAALVSATGTRREVARLQNDLAELQGRVLRAAPSAAETGGRRSVGAAAPSEVAPPAPAAASSEVEASPAAESAPAAAAAVAPAAAAPPRPSSPLPGPPAPPFDLGRFVERAAIWAFAGLGGLLLVIAVLFGLREAIAAGWFGPVARFAGAVAVGLGAWLVGELLHWRRYATPAAALSGAGAAILYAALFSAHSRWGLVGQTPAFVSMAGVSAVAMLLAERRDSRFVAVLAMLGGYATPILLSTGENRAVAFFGYLALVDAGLLLVARRRHWPEFVALSGGATLLLYLGWMASFRAPDQVPVGLGAAAALGGMYLLLARGADDSLRARLGAFSAVGTALVLWLVATLAFATPTDPLRFDPISSRQLTWNLGTTAWMGAVWVIAGALVLPLLLRKNLVTRGLAAGVTAFGAAAVIVAWVAAGEPRWEVAVAVGVSASLLSWGAAGAWGGGAMLASVSLATGAAAVASPVPAGLLVPLVLGLAASALVGTFRTGSRLPLVALATAGALPLYGRLSARFDDGEAGPLALATAAIYLCCAVLPLLLPRRADLPGAIASAAAPLTLGLPLLGLWRHAMGTELDGVLPVLLGANALAGALVLVRSARSALAEREVALLLAVTLAAAAVAVPLQLDRAWLTVGWAILVTLLAGVHRRVKSPLFVATAAILGVAVAVRLLLNPYALEYGRGDGPIILNWTLYTWGIPTVCLLLAARWFEVGWLKIGLRTIAILTGFALVNLEVAHAFAHDDTLSFHSEQLGQEMVRSISWGVYGLGLILVGIRNRSRAVRIGGLAFAVLAAGKVFAVDMWSLEGFARVGAFGGLAVTLLAAAVAFAWLARKDEATEKSGPETSR